jgi:hypothetical protein
MTWTTQSLDRKREYILIQHTLRGVNYSVMGVTFRDSYAVVEKNSKTYHSLKRIPVLRTAKEYPLLALKNLKFITRTLDVQFIFGKDVYNHYIKELNAHLAKVETQAKEEAIIKHIEENIKCKFLIDNKDLCQKDAKSYSPSCYCEKHLFNDPRLEEFGITIPPFLTKDEKKELRQTINSKLEKLKSQGKF